MGCTSRGSSRALRHADGRDRLARHPRIAVADVGEHGRARAAVHAPLLPRTRAEFPDALADVTDEEFYAA